MALTSPQGKRRRSDEELPAPLAGALALHVSNVSLGKFEYSFQKENMQRKRSTPLLHTLLVLPFRLSIHLRLTRRLQPHLIWRLLLHLSLT